MSSSRAVGVTNSTDNWNYAQNHVERHMDDAAYTSAHPNNTLILAGPARFASITDPNSQLLALGAIQNFSFGGNAPVQPAQAVGSGRLYYTRGKGQVSFSLSRTMLDGRNIMRALYTQAIQSGLDVSKFREPAVRNASTETFYANLDSELFYIPTGIAVLIRSVMDKTIGGMYIELGMINSIQFGWGAGQTMVVESLSGIADRAIPIYPDGLPGISNAPTANEVSNAMLGLTGPANADLNLR